jgi:hypothetical protein
MGRPALLAAVTGFVLWFAASLLTGRREPWDSSLYWTFFYPLALLACGALSYFHPRRAATWAFVLFGFQFVAMCVRNAELGGLWPLGLALFAVLAMPGVFVARHAVRMRERHDGDVT